MGLGNLYNTSRLLKCYQNHLKCAHVPYNTLIHSLEFNTVGGAKIPTKYTYFPHSVMRKKASPEICLTSPCVRLLMDSIKGAHLMLAEVQTALEKELFQVLRSIKREGRQEKCCETVTFSSQNAFQKQQSGCYR